jgi:hypothetical protein
MSVVINCTGCKQLRPFAKNGFSQCKQCHNCSATFCPDCASAERRTMGRRKTKGGVLERCTRCTCHPNKTHLETMDLLEYACELLRMDKAKLKKLLQARLWKDYQQRLRQEDYDPDNDSDRDTSDSEQESNTRSRMHDNMEDMEDEESDYEDGEVEEEEDEDDEEEEEEEEEVEEEEEAVQSSGVKRKREEESVYEEQDTMATTVTEEEA